MTKLEKEIIEWYGVKYNNLDLDSLSDVLEVNDREITEIGFFTYFKQTDPNPKLLDSVFMNIPGPYIHSEQLHGGAMSLLSVKNGVVISLEVLALDEDESANDVVDFKLGEQF